MNQDKYVLITPVKDEGKYISETLKSVISQTILPVQWIIVDDGSTDDTNEIIRKFSNGLDWIKLVENNNSSIRNTGIAEVFAFNIGLKHIDIKNYDFIVKLDGDIQFDRDYFEKIINRFNEDKHLGIASGVYLEKKGGRWEVIIMPDYHAAGASKFIRKVCFEQIEGFITEPGWDTVDEIRAQYSGWRTTHFKDIPFYHLKKEGMAMGYKKTNMMHGEIYYRTNGGKVYLIFKAVDRILHGKPFLLAGYYMLLGYLLASINRKPLLINKEEAWHYRMLLNERVRVMIRRKIFQIKTT